MNRTRSFPPRSPLTILHARLATPALPLLLALALSGASCAAPAQQITCPCIADTWLGEPEPGAPAAFENHGSDPQLLVSGRVAFALLNFDLSAAKGLTVSKATLRIHRAPAPGPRHTLGLDPDSRAGPWGEGTQKDGRAQLGAANVFFALAGQRAWSYPGSDFTDVTFGLAGSLYAYLPARAAEGDWYEIDVPLPLVHALLAGDQYGWLLTDEKGQTWTNHKISSRESDHPPVLLLQGQPTDKTPPGPVRNLKSGPEPFESTPADAQALARTTLRPGAVVLRLGQAGDDAGQGIATRYDLRYATGPITADNFDLATPAPRWSMKPLAPKTGPLATANTLHDQVAAVVEDLRPGAIYHFAARAVDEAGNAGPVCSLGRYKAYARDFPPLPAEPGGRAARRGQPTTQPAGPVHVWAVSDLVKINPQTGELLEADGYSQHRLRNRVWDAASSTVKLTGARNEFVAFQLAVENPQPLAAIEVKVTGPLFAQCKLPACLTSGAIQLYRLWSVPDERSAELPADQRQWYPDALVPLDGPFDLPAKDNAIPNQTVQPLFMDVYIPHDAPPGQHTAKLQVTAAPNLKQDITIQIEVLPLTLPNHLSFVVDLNCYGGVNRGYDIQRGTQQYRQLEWAYHRLAHLDRTNLNILAYSQSGDVQPDHAPPLQGQGAETKVASWGDWDAHFGPLLDGSAFADLPRASVPILAMYLPFHENWPGDIHKDYKFDFPNPKTEPEYRPLVTRHALEATPIEDAFSQPYQQRFSAVAAQFAEHIRQRGWTKTYYQLYLNNKYYWKNPSQGGRGSAWWLLDEPNHRDDIRALAFFANLLKRGLAGYENVPIILRTDISRVYWIRDTLAGQIDLNCVSGSFYDKNRYLVDNRDRFGRTYWNYGSTNHPRDTNVTMRAWCWRVWLLGGDGLLPWNAVGGAEAWTRAEPLTVFYAGAKFGKNEPFPSVRLKAYRRGQQDVEYLILLAQKQGWDRDAVARVVSSALNLRTTVEELFPEDAGTIRFERLDDDELDRVRLRVARALVAP